MSYYLLETMLKAMQHDCVDSFGWLVRSMQLHAQLETMYMRHCVDFPTLHNTFRDTALLSVASSEPNQGVVTRFEHLDAAIVSFSILRLAWACI